MEKKVIDILPSKKYPEKKPSPKKITKRKFTLKLPPFFFKFSPIFLILLFGIFGYFLSIKFSQVEIKIWPKIEELKVEEKIRLDAKSESINQKEKTIPGKIFETETEFSDEFSATGKVLKKAHGKIVLFNEYTTKDEVWAAGTRFMSSQGKLFKSKDKIFVPGAKIEGGKIKPSQVEVEVEAAEGGADYNIGPSEFSVVAFKGTERYFKYYAKSFEPMKGGGEFPKIEKADLEMAEKALIEKANKLASDFLKSKLPEGVSVLKDGIFVEVLEKSSNFKEGDEVEKFSFKIKVKIKAFCFEEKTLNKFVEEYLKEIALKPNQAIYWPSLKITPKTESVNFDAKKANLSLEIFAKTFFDFDQNLLKKAIADKTIQEAKLFLMSQEQFLRVKIEIAPFWAKKVPANINQIKITFPLVD
mgnify:CR=1 FL=1